MHGLTSKGFYIHSHISQGPQPSRERLRERPRGIRPTSGAQCLQQDGSHLACQPPTNLETHCALISLICQNDPAWPRKSVTSLASCTDRKNRKTRVHGSRTSFWSPSNSALYGVLRFTAYCGHYIVATCTNCLFIALQPWTKQVIPVEQGPPLRSLYKPSSKWRSTFQMMP